MTPKRPGWLPSASRLPSRLCNYKLKREAPRRGVSLFACSSAVEGRAEGRAPLPARGEAGRSGTLLPLLRIVHRGGQRVPRLDTDEAQGLRQGRPDEGIGEAGHIADDAAARVLLVDAQRPGAQARHAEAVVVEEVVGQLDGLLVLPLVVAFARQQAAPAGVEDDRALGLVEAELVVLDGVAVIERHLKGRVVADAEPQLFGAGVRDGEGVVKGLSVQPEGAGEQEVEGELLRLHGLIRAQLQPDGVALRLQQGVLHVPGKTVLAALVGLAAMGEAAVLELARPREEDGRVALPNRRIGLPEQLLPRRVLQADGLGTVCVHRKAQKFVLNGRLHLSALLFVCVLLIPVYSPRPEKPRGFTHSLTAE